MHAYHIYIDGVDGTGKTTIVQMLKNAGYQYVYDRSILTKMSIISADNLPQKIMDNGKIIQQINRIKELYPPNELVTNRDVMTKLSLDNSTLLEDNTESKENSVIYIILDAEVDTSVERLKKRVTETKIKLNAWDSRKSIKYFRSKYLFLAYKYRIPIIDTENKSVEQVYNEIIDLIEEKNIYVPRFQYIGIENPVEFKADLLELEWLYLGESRIIYADTQHYVLRGNYVGFDIESYQKNVTTGITQNCLTKFINKLRKKDMEKK